MKRKILLASCAVLMFGAAPALADCADELAKLKADGGMQVEASATGEASGEDSIAKDGSLAPLQEAATGADAAMSGSADGDVMAGHDGGTMAEHGGDAMAEGDAEVTKDGSTAPLEESADGEAGVPEAGSGTAIATSAQDAQAQQGGGEIAAAEAADDGASAEADALARAEAALASGDEDACMEAVEEARS